jgi:hypothetical protein
MTQGSDPTNPNDSPYDEKHLQGLGIYDSELFEAMASLNSNEVPLDADGLPIVPNPENAQEEDVQTRNIKTLLELLIQKRTS